MSARPVPLPVTEEVPLAFVVGRTLPGETAPVLCAEKHGHNGSDEPWRWCVEKDALSSTWKPLPVSPSGMVTVQREGDEK